MRKFEAEKAERAEKEALKNKGSPRLSPRK